mmetsp:Transcript_52513/g.132731  ORF Transcript_52513/g.132731 Transcript_52513/m.132731 type:complete len:82 (+) Transcript_52513:566-811(+)
MLDSITAAALGELLHTTRAHIDSLTEEFQDVFVAAQPTVCSHTSCATLEMDTNTTTQVDTFNDQIEVLSLRIDNLADEMLD